MNIPIVIESLKLILVDEGIHSITGFFPPLSDVKRRVRITRLKNGRNSFRMDIGRPNYAERRFLKLCKKAKTKPKRFCLKPFPDK